jgi:hypothetical protein
MSSESQKLPAPNIQHNSGINRAPLPSGKISPTMTSVLASDSDRHEASFGPDTNYANGNGLAVCKTVGMIAMRFSITGLEVSMPDGQSGGLEFQDT